MPKVKHYAWVAYILNGDYIQEHLHLADDGAITVIYVNHRQVGEAFVERNFGVKQQEFLIRSLNKLGIGYKLGEEVEIEL